MRKVLFLLFALSGFVWFLYGVLHIFLEVERNACEMTYMFGYPRFLRIPTDDKKFPNYGLYYYYEGPSDSSARKFTGAPIIFVPGNGGSYKQVRSLASVALRKSLDLDNKLKINYFTIDYDEELTGLHGGYLLKQQLFLQHCIGNVLKLYKNEKKVVLIGHSMGGKVAQSILLHNNSLAQMVNTMVFISSPLDRPVVYFDALISDFYQTTQKYLRQHRAEHIATNITNYCSQQTAYLLSVEEKSKSAEYSIEHILLLSIGGGNRDLLVNDVLTSSIYSDVHAMTSAIPNVWLSCDHLAAVWCLQLILVINRFLFNILKQDSSFVDDRQLRLQQAQNFFGKTVTSHLPSPPNDVAAIWNEDERLSYTKSYEARRKVTHYQLISIRNNVGKTLYAELANLTDVDWIFGCFIVVAPNSNTSRQCENGENLSNMSLKIPGFSHLNRMAINLPLADKSVSSNNWTHLVIRIPVTENQARLQIDLHDSTERSRLIHIKPWYSAFSFLTKYSITNTKKGAAYFELTFPKLQALFPALTLYVEPYDCKHLSIQRVTARTCIPWARGFEQFHQSTAQDSQALSFLLSLPVSKPHNYNTTENSVQVELFLDPQCLHAISYSISFGGAASRIVRNFFPYLPAHLAAVLLLVLRQHMFTPAKSLKGVTFLSAFLRPTSTLILAVCSLALYTIAIFFALLPTQDDFIRSLNLQLIIHSTALVTGILLALLVWLLLLLANCFARTLGLWKRLSNLFSTLLETVGHLFSFSLCVVLISIACYGSGGVALIFAGLIYFIKTARICEIIRQYLLPYKSSEILNALFSIIHGTDLVNIHVQMSQFLLLLLLILLNLPASIACIKSWHNYPNNSLPDHTLVYSLVVLGCLSLIWQLKCSQPVRGNKIVSCLLYVCASVCVTFCQEAMFRLNYIIAAVFVVILFQQVLSSNLIFKSE